MKTDELREKYLAFFETKGCVRRPSDVLVPRWDPSVLFTPAGMNQFKDHFMGRCKLEFTRATTCQKCLRTGDIDNVGRTAYHHTFFEMLGNFSFGDYFKREAIQWAWEFLTDKKWLALDPAKISATVYLDDDEAASIWTDVVGLPSEKVERLGEDENFWPANAPSQGPDGVCGPCSEIYYHTEHGAVEIWNLVFTQFNRVGAPPDNLRPLPSKNIDTGMGLERTAAVLQGVETNYHIDILRPLVEAAGQACGVPYEPNSDAGRRLRRIADHVRACAFAIHENVYPGNKEEKYVIKRLLRRAVLDGRQLGCDHAFLHELVPVVADLMKAPYPELGETTQRVAQVMRSEEEHFSGTIDSGLERIERIFDDMKKENRRMVLGEDAFEMYQTYGFPPELFETLAAEHNFAFDWDGFRDDMKRHGEISGSEEKHELFQQDPLEGIKKMYRSEFRGYEEDEVAGAQVVGIVAEGRLVDVEDEIDRGAPVSVILTRTPFYGERGGQVGDCGELVGDGFRFEVQDTQHDGDLIVHRGHLREGQIRLGSDVTARVDRARRRAIARAHTATHLLHSALRQTLGAHAEQQGSKVDADWLRFDFTNPEAIPRQTLIDIERRVNEMVLENTPVRCENQPLTDARKSGAVMLFGEKYPDMVRVVSTGPSKELCGGTHLSATGEIGLLKIVGDESVSAGTRRITAITGLAALDHVAQLDEAIHGAGAVLRVPPPEIPARVEALAKEVRKLKKELAAGPRGSIAVEDLLQSAETLGDTQVIVADVPGANPNGLRDLIDKIRRKTTPAAVLLGAVQGDDKVMLVAGLTRDLVERKLDAVAWVREAAQHVDGSGGGRPDMAQAGGKNPEGLSEALRVAKAAIASQLSS